MFKTLNNWIQVKVNGYVTEAIKNRMLDKVAMHEAAIGAIDMQRMISDVAFFLKSDIALDASGQLADDDGLKEMVAEMVAKDFERSDLRDRIVKEVASNIDEDSISERVAEGIEIDADDIADQVKNEIDTDDIAEAAADKIAEGIDEEDVVKQIVDRFGDMDKGDIFTRVVEKLYEDVPQQSVIDDAAQRVADGLYTDDVVKAAAKIAADNIDTGDIACEVANRLVASAGEIDYQKLAVALLDARMNETTSRRKVDVMNNRFYLVHREDSDLWQLCGKSGSPCQTPGSLARAMELIKRFEKVKANGVTWPVPVWSVKPDGDGGDICKWYGHVDCDGWWSFVIENLIKNRPATGTNRPA